MSHVATARLAEVGFLLFVIAGVWIVAAEVMPPRWARFRLSVSGALVAVGGLLLIVAMHSGTFA